MKTSLWLAAGAAALIVGTLDAQSFNVRPGNWEVTMTMGGTMPMPGVPPEMRAAIEAELRKPQTSQSCVTAEDIKNFDLAKMGNDESCKTLTQKITATTADFTRQCTDDGKTVVDTAHFEAPSPQSMSANIARKGDDGTMTISMTGRWLSAECKN